VMSAPGTTHGTGNGGGMGGATGGDSGVMAPQGGMHGGAQHQAPPQQTGSGFNAFAGMGGLAAALPEPARPPPPGAFNANYDASNPFAGM